jgi:hypothetical protein
LDFSVGAVSFHEEGVLLSFDNQKGVVLEWSGAEARFEELQAIQGSFIFKAFIPSVRVVYNQIDGGGSHYRGTGAEVLISFDNPDPRGRAFTKALLKTPLLHEYVRVSVPSWKQKADYSLSYQWENSLIPVGDLIAGSAKIWIRISAHAENDPVHGVSLKPRPELGLEFAEPIPFEEIRDNSELLRELFELLSGRPCGERTTRFYDNDICVVLREPLENRSLGTQTNPPLRLDYALCGPYLGEMIGPWFNKVGRSPAVENLLRLLYYPDLPIDLRYFMAFSALGYLNVEQRHAGNHRAKIKEIEHLKAFHKWWEILVPNASAAELEHYLNRVANTRHDIAHLSRPPHEILSERHDMLRAYNQLHVLARACLFESMGLPHVECELYVSSLANYLESHFGPVSAALLK